MEENVSFTIKLKVGHHKKLKVLSAISGKSMTDLISEWIDKQDVTYDGSIEKLSKPETVKSDIHKAGKVDEGERAAIIKKIMAMDEEGIKPYSIAKKLDAEGVQTLKGGKKWSESTVKGIIKREKGTEDVKNGR